MYSRPSASRNLSQRPSWADHAADALRQVADEIPAEIASDVDLVELRVAVDPEQRTCLGEDTQGS